LLLPLSILNMLPSWFCAAAAAAAAAASQVL